MTRECTYCGTEYIDYEKYCECGGMIKMIRRGRDFDNFTYMMGYEKYNNIDNLLESKRIKRT